MPRLYVVATPIGNLSDASGRMVETLRAVPLVIAEDTRVTANLLRHFGITAQLTSLHRHNEAEKAAQLVRRMVQEDIDAALVTDAGTPAISDPGNRLVALAGESGIEVLAVPGPSAVIAALSVSGIDARVFTFYGFLPRGRGDLEAALRAMDRSCAAVVYESPHRIVALLDAAARVLPDVAVSVSTELTKLHEKTLRGPAEAVAARLRADPYANKGEYCVVLDLRRAGTENDTEPKPPESPRARLLDMLIDGIAMPDALQALIQSGVRKNEAKRAALAVKDFLRDQAGKA